MHMTRKNWDVDNIIQQIRSIHRQVNNVNNDGFTASGCKRDLFMIKCILEDLYDDTPKFSIEDQWYQERTINLLKRPIEASK